MWLPSMKDIGMNSTDGMISYPDVHWWGSEAPRGGISEAVAHELQLILESSEQESGGGEPSL